MLAQLAFEYSDQLICYYCSRVTKKKSSNQLNGGTDTDGQAASQSTGLEPDIDADSDEPFIDPQVLARIKFSQIGERRNWEGINVHYSGIPGNISLNINERVLLFKQEMER